jgi:hypothetical protein
MVFRWRNFQTLLVKFTDTIKIIRNLTRWPSMNVDGKDSSSLPLFTAVLKLM